MGGKAGSQNAIVDLQHQLSTIWVFRKMASPMYIFYVQSNVSLYYIKTNEIPGELSRESMTSSHVKRSLLLWLHNKWHLSQQKQNSLGFHWCLYNK